MRVAPFILLCTISIPGGIFSAENRGRLFLTAFPENVAFYDPLDHQHTLILKALLNDTNVSVTVGPSESILSRVLNAADVENVRLSESVELQRDTLSNKSVLIRASKDIVVVSKITRGDGQQTVALQPMTSLGSLYYTPNLTSHGSIENGLAFKDFHGARGKIVVINSDKINVVEVSSSGQGLEKKELEPFQVFQINISDLKPVKIDAKEKVAVLLTHPCAKTNVCNCEMMVIQLRPSDFWGRTFILPDAGNKTVTVTSNQSVTLEAESFPSTVSAPPSSFYHFIHDLRSQYLTSSKTSSLMLIRLGHITEIVPNSHFAACLLTFNMSSKALVIVPDSKKEEVRLGKDPLEADWTLIDSLNYSWAEIALPNANDHVIWHPSAKITVYVKNGEKWSAALSVSAEPDPQGCLLDQEAYIVSEESGTWAESIGYCQQANAELVSINSEDVLQRLSEKLSNPMQAREAWVGLRRRLLNGEWYWQNNQAMNTSKWEQGQPGHLEEKFCASMSLRSSKTWRSRSCCDTMKAVCYRKGIYFPLDTDVLSRRISLF